MSPRRARRASPRWQGSRRNSALAATGRSPAWRHRVSRPSRALLITSFRSFRQAWPPALYPSTTWCARIVPSIFCQPHIHADACADHDGWFSSNSGSIDRSRAQTFHEGSLSRRARHAGRCGRSGKVIEPASIPHMEICDDHGQWAGSRYDHALEVFVHGGTSAPGSGRDVGRWPFDGPAPAFRGGRNGVPQIPFDSGDRQADSTTASACNSDCAGVGLSSPLFFAPAPTFPTTWACSTMLQARRLEGRPIKALARAETGPPLSARRGN